MKYVTLYLDMQSMEDRGGMEDMPLCKDCIQRMDCMDSTDYMDCMGYMGYMGPGQLEVFVVLQSVSMHSILVGRKLCQLLR